MNELRRLGELSDYALHALDGDIGRLVQVLFDDRNWWVRYLVVRTGGWLFGREVLLLPDMVRGVDHEQRRIDIGLMREQIRNAPPIETKMPVSRVHEQAFFHHYGWAPYWGDDPLFGLDAPILPTADDPPAEPANPHLRSSDEVTGYRIRAEDGEIGEVRDFVLEVPGWRLRYLDVTTGNWLTGREVLIACAWLETVDWSGRAVTTVLRRAAIASAPPYDRGKVIGRDDEVAMYKHYGRHFEEND